MRATTGKLEAISRHAEAVKRDANAAPRDPILLINGKHLVQGSLARRDPRHPADRELGDPP